jgi:hypothetical protein
MLEGTALVQLGLGALGMLVAQHLVSRLFFVPGAESRESPLGAGANPRVHHRQVSGRDGGVPGQGSSDPGHGGWVPESRPEPQPLRSTVQMGATQHVEGFIEFCLLEDDEVRLPRERMVQSYLGWCREFSIVPLPPSVFLAVLAKHPLVERTRVRKKDNRGRVPRTATGKSPQRHRLYVISLPAKPAKRPGTVPVTDLVAPRPVAKPPRAGKPAQPLPAAAKEELPGIIIVDEPIRRAA